MKNNKGFALVGIPIIIWVVIIVALFILGVFSLSAVEGLLRNINPFVFAGLIALVVWLIVKYRKK